MTDFKGTPLFRTMVEVPSVNPLIRPNDGFVFLGSCFAQNIGDRFSSFGLPALVNPLGTLYNPCSVELVLSQAVCPDVDPYLFSNAGQYYCWLSGTKLEASTREACRDRVVAALSALRSALASSRYVFLTFGTSVVYRHCQLGRIVCNCHRISQSLFSEEHLSVKDCTEAILHSVRLAQQINPDIRVVLTVSPYRYAKYGFHGSQLAKSVLLLAVDEVCNSCSDVCTYFPSYEIVLDELRDYRFYTSDMFHPSSDAVDYIWQRLVQSAFSSEAMAYLTEYAPIRQGLMHRSLSPDSESEKTRIEKLLKRKSELQKRYAICPQP